MTTRQSGHTPAGMDRLAKNMVIEFNHIFINLQVLMRFASGAINRLLVRIYGVTVGDCTTEIHSGNSAATQRSKILQHLQEKGSTSTVEARRMGICHPGMRVSELRKAGYPIETLWVNNSAPDGSSHRAALYVLRLKKQLLLPGMEGK